jgi:hypothetical protein
MQVLIAIPIVAILSLAMATMISSLARQNRQISQKLDTIEFRQLLSPIIADDAHCTKMLLGIPVKTNENPSASLSVLKTSSTGNALVTANALLPGSSAGVKVSAIELRDFVGTGTDNEYNMNLRINWDPNSLVMALQPIQYAKIVTVDPATKKISGCQSTPSDSGGSGPPNNCVPRTCSKSPCNCQAGETPQYCFVRYQKRVADGKSWKYETVMTSGFINGTGCKANVTGSNLSITVQCCK